MPKRSILLTVAVLFVVTACGDDTSATTEALTTTVTALPTTTPTGEATTTVDPAVLEAVGYRLADRMLEDVGEYDTVFTRPADLDCLAQGIVSEIGLERLTILGVTTDQVPDPAVLFGRMRGDEIDQIIHIALACEDVVAELRDAVVGAGVGATAAECFVGALELDGFFTRVIYDSVLLGLDENAQGDEGLAAAADQCLTSDEQSRLFGTATTIPAGG